MSEMVERVAKVIFDHWFCGVWPPSHEVDLAMGAEDFRSCARWVLAAMREPTDEMIGACPHLGQEAEGEPEEIWRAMIGAALAD